MGARTRPVYGEGRRTRVSRARHTRGQPPGVMATACWQGYSDATREIPRGGGVRQPAARESQAGPRGKSERSIVPRKPGNAGGGKGPHFRVNVRRGDSRRLAMSLLPPDKVGKLQAALQAKAKEAPNYRFYALYDKIYRWDVLCHAYERCRANGGEA